MAPDPKTPCRRSSASFSSRQHRSRSGFTLLEAIVAIVMFTFIIMAVSAAFSVSLQASNRSQHRQEDDGAVRAVFDSITRDIQAAFASPNSPASLFMAGAGSSSGPGGSSGSSDLLTFSALSTRLQTPELDTQSGNSSVSPSPNAQQGTSQPQSDMALVKYTFDSGSGTLYRIVSAVPSSQALSQSSPSLDQALAQNIVAVKLSFWDRTQQTWRDDWDYEQPNQAQPAASTGGQSGTTGGAASTTGSQSTSATTATGDTMLPIAVKITLTLQKSDGNTQDYITTVPIAASQTYSDPNQTANVNSNPPATTTGSSGP